MMMIRKKVKIIDEKTRGLFEEKVNELLSEGK